MIRYPEQWAARWAVTLGLASSFGSMVGSMLLLGGCGRESTEPAAPVPPITQQAIASPNPAPQLFAVPDVLAPLPQPELPPGNLSPHSVQAQYAQTASPPAPIKEPPAAPSEGIYAPRQHVAPAAASRPAPQPGRVPAAAPSASSAVGQQALAMQELAAQMAQKGMLFAAKDELTHALELVAQARDIDQGTTWHVAALAAGLTALREADDFAPQPGRDPGLRVSDIVRGHRTTILQSAGEISPLAAPQYYRGYAQQQVALAVAGEPAASQALYVLGKVESALAQTASAAPSLHASRALIYYQAALAVDQRNYRAANELGVLLARDGQLAEAKRALLHSISIQPHEEGWHNLATVHRRLGETQLAQLAENERQLLAGRSTPAKADAEKSVTWVDARTFASAGRGESREATSATRTATTTSSPSQRR